MREERGAMARLDDIISARLRQACVFARMQAERQRIALRYRARGRWPQAEAAVTRQIRRPRRLGRKT